MSGPANRFRRVRGGALVVTAALLISSATLRIGAQAGTAIAKEMPDSVTQASGAHITEAETADLRDAGQMIPRKMASAEPMVNQFEMMPEDMQHLLSALRNREQQLNRREMQIEDRMKALGIADEAIDRKLAALIEAEERLSATLALADGASEGDLAKLTEVYEKMKPKDAAALFEEMTPEFSAGFLGRMKPAAAASVMAGLKPKTAYTISVILAGRNAWVPKD
ncbi:MAG: hypothetical protein L3J36_11505 [Rhodobacteraceae bacterium]|nr:hypothetical protein [Paracoccaceae bacterium]